VLADRHGDLHAVLTCLLDKRKLEMEMKIFFPPKLDP